MRKLIAFAFVSLDGVMQAPGGPDEDRSGNFSLGGWIVPYADDAIGQQLQALISPPFALLLGRRTYDIFAAYWPHVPADSPSQSIAKSFNSVPKHVATHRADDLDWHNSHALESGLVDAVRRLLRDDGPNLLTFGSGDVVRQLLAAGLVDELHVLTYPVVLGQGKRLFGNDASPSSFEVASSACTPAGVVITRYVRAGAVRTASFDDA
jgi:dihydrofolate reductase